MRVLRREVTAGMTKAPESSRLPSPCERDCAGAYEIKNSPSAGLITIGFLIYETPSLSVLGA